MKAYRTRSYTPRYCTLPASLLVILLSTTPNAILPANAFLPLQPRKIHDHIGTCTNDARCSSALSYSATSSNDNNANVTAATTKPFSYIETLKDKSAATATATSTLSAVWSEDVNATATNNDDGGDDSAVVMTRSPNEFQATLTSSSIDDWYNLLTRLEDDRSSEDDESSSTPPAPAPDTDTPKPTDHWMF
jgi:hypothetical protein